MDIPLVSFFICVHWHSCQNVFVSVQALQIRYCWAGIIYCFCIREVKYPTQFVWLFLVIEARHLEAKDANGNYACREVAKKHSAGRLIKKPKEVLRKKKWPREIVEARNACTQPIFWNSKILITFRRALHLYAFISDHFVLLLLHMRIERWHVTRPLLWLPTTVFGLLWTFFIQPYDDLLYLTIT